MHTVNVLHKLLSQSIPFLHAARLCALMSVAQVNPGYNFI